MWQHAAASAQLHLRAQLAIEKKKKTQRYVDGGPSVRPPPEETQRGVFLITSISELSPVVIWNRAPKGKLDPVERTNVATAELQEKPMGLL